MFIKNNNVLKITSYLLVILCLSSICSCKKIDNEIYIFSDISECKNIEISELVDIIKSSMPGSAMRDGHPAKRTFQAIRIEVNDELNGLKIALNDSLKLLKSGGRIAVITFHSLEDKIVKEIFKNACEGESWNRNMPINLENKKSEYRLISKKPILPTEEELKLNNRAHSAKLRIIEKI